MCKQEHILRIIGVRKGFVASLVIQRVKSLPAMWETWVGLLGRDDPLEKEMATLSNIPAWKIPWMEEPSGLQSMRLQKVRRNWVTNTYIGNDLHIEKESWDVELDLKLEVWSCFFFFFQCISIELFGNTDMHIFLNHYSL